MIVLKLSSKRFQFLNSGIKACFVFILYFWQIIFMWLSRYCARYKRPIVLAANWIFLHVKFLLNFCIGNPKFLLDNFASFWLLYERIKIREIFVQIFDFTSTSVLVSADLNWNKENNYEWIDFLNWSSLDSLFSSQIYNDSHGIIETDWNVKLTFGLSLLKPLQEEMLPVNYRFFLCVKVFFGKFFCDR